MTKIEVRPNAGKLTVWEGETLLYTGKNDADAFSFAFGFANSKLQMAELKLETARGR